MQNIDLLFLLLGAVLVLAMHAGFAFLELGTVRHKNQVNALSKILTDFAISAIAYFLVGYYIAYGQHFFHDAATLSADHGYNLMRCFFLLTFAAAIPAIISGGIAERAKMRSQALATLFLVALIYPFFEGMIWNGNLGFQDWLTDTFGASFHDFAFKKLFYGSVNACDISINQLLRYAISQQATSIVIAHNHPLGRPSPSKADLALTHQIQQACQLVDIHLIDHCIIALEGSFSFAEQQLIKPEMQY